MCLKQIDFYSVCGHNGHDDPNVASICEILERCPGGDGKTCPNNKLRTRDEQYEGECWACLGDHEDFEKFWYKACNQSTVCDHEFDHMLTNLRRFPEEEDIVLITPKDCLCPDCNEAGFDRRPGGSNPPPKTASHMPSDFKGLYRAVIKDIPRISTVPVATLRPASPERVDASRIPSNTYNPGASRVPPRSKAPTRPSQAQQYTSKAPGQSQVPSSRYPGGSKVPAPSTRLSNHLRESSRPSQNPPGSYAPSAKPTTAIYNPTSKVSRVPDAASSKQPALTPEELLKRGPPKNVNASAFYDNPDGDDAKANLARSPTTAPSHSGQSIRPSNTPKSKTSASQEYQRTQAPPSDAPGPDLDKLLSSQSIIPSATALPSHSPSSRPSPSKVPQWQPSRTPGGHTAYPSSSSPSSRPRASTVPESKVPRHSQVPSQSRVPPASKQAQTPTLSTSRPSELPRPSQAPYPPTRPSDLPSRSRVPASPSTQPSSPPKKSQAPAQTAHPAYHTQASPESAYPSNTPPHYGGSVSKSQTSASSRTGRVPALISSVAEEDERRRH